jgi:hypothetical protein
VIYRYIARGSVHREHLCEVERWRKGKAKAYCLYCNEYFVGTARCFRKYITEKE